MAFEHRSIVVLGVFLIFTQPRICNSAFFLFFAFFAVAEVISSVKFIGWQFASSIIKGCFFSVRFLVNNLKRSLFKILTMRLSEFILLNEDEKKSTVLHQGVCLAKRSSFDSIVFLFQLGSYYVEAYCNPANKAIEEYIDV
jgi:membrane-associated HD superfamily phosphohydrolase